jgi:hypothetical protein
LFVPTGERAREGEEERGEGERATERSIGSACDALFVTYVGKCGVTSTKALAY